MKKNPYDFYQKIKQKWLQNNTKDETKTRSHLYLGRNWSLNMQNTGERISHSRVTI